jgi:hypothetical protein
MNALRPVLVALTLTTLACGGTFFDEALGQHEGEAKGKPKKKPGAQCGAATCAVGEVCCNPSCGICTPPDGACIQMECGDLEPLPPVGEVCGDAVCGEGLVCCNASCGICAPPDGACTQQACEPLPEEPECAIKCAAPPEGCRYEGGVYSGPCSQLTCGTLVCDDAVPCGNNTCTGGEVCCNESCGICAPPDGACIQMQCEDLKPLPPGGEVCGKTVCGEGEVCCNASCGICTPPGYACIQLACE